MRRAYAAALAAFTIIHSGTALSINETAEANKMIHPTDAEEHRTRVLLTSECPSTCFGYTCDDWIASDGATCEYMEGAPYYCDCSGCHCGEWPPSATPTTPFPTTLSPTVSFAPTVIYTAETYAELADAGTNDGAYVDVLQNLTFTGQLAVDGIRLRVFSSVGLGLTLDGGGSTRLFYVSNGGSLTLESVTLANGFHDISGGAVDVKGGSVLLRSCVLRGNTVNRYNGYNGGGVSLDGGYGTTTAKFENCLFDSNAARDMAGAVYVSHGASAQFDGCTFTSNVADWDSGAVEIRMGQAKASFADCTFIGNTAYGSTQFRSEGGAVRSDNEASTSFLRCRFESNRAGDGGAVIAYGGAELTNCSFFSNTADRFGGAAAGADMRFSSCFFISNSGLTGGALYASSGTVETSTFSSNRAAKGGAIYAFGAIELRDCVLASCTASEEGAAVYSDSDVKLLDSVVHSFDSSDLDAAHIFYHAGTGSNVLVVDRTTFRNNSLAAFYADTARSVLVRNCGGLVTNDAASSSMLQTCNDVSSEVCYKQEYCRSAESIGIKCYCYPDDVMTDPNLGLPCDSSALMTFPVKVFTLLIDKPQIGSVLALFENSGDVALAWNLSAPVSLEPNMWWDVLPSISAGTLQPCGLGQLTLVLNSTWLQAREAPYTTRWTMNSSSPTPTPAPRSSSYDIVVNTYVSATPDAAASYVNITNIGRLTAAGKVEFAVTTIDETGLVILDATGVAWSASLVHSASGVSVACGVPYDTSSRRHKGECQMQGLEAGAFELRVKLGSVAAGGGAYHITVEGCPASFELSDDRLSCTCAAGHYVVGNTCDECPDGTHKPDPGVGKGDCVACQTGLSTAGRTSNANHTACDACEDKYFRAAGGCRACPNGAVCTMNSDVTTIVLLPGHWRASAESTDVRECRFGKLSCPGDGENQKLGPDPYCALEYVGPLCSECHQDFFNSWDGAGVCQACAARKSHLPTIGLVGTVVLLFGAPFVYAFKTCSTQKPDDAPPSSSGIFANIEKLFVLAKVKIFTLFLTAQVISQFATISSGTGDSTYPEPAATLVRALGMANLDILGFVPLGCVFRSASFYDKVLFKSTAPLAVLVFLACYPISERLRGRPSEPAARSAKRLSLLLLEITLPSTTTTLIQTFICQQFDNGAFLRESLTIACDDSPRRRLWVVLSAVTLVVYMIGVPTLIFSAMFQYRHAIQELGVKLQQHNEQRGRTSLTANELVKSKQARSSFVSLHWEMRWLLPKFEKFRPEAWFTGVLLLLLRLLQTSAVTFVRSQLAQAAIVCFITLVSILLHSELSPMRRSSDNHVALMAQVLVFLWTFVLLLRSVGLFEQAIPALVVGVLLCVTTLAVLVIALVLTNMDRLNEQRSSRRLAVAMPDNKGATSADNIETPQEALSGESSHSHGAGEPEKRARAPPREDLEEKVEEPPTNDSLMPWPLLALGNCTLCRAEPMEGGASSES